MDENVGRCGSGSGQPLDVLPKREVATLGGTVFPARLSHKRCPKLALPPEATPRGSFGKEETLKICTERGAKLSVLTQRSQLAQEGPQQFPGNRWEWGRRVSEVSA